MEIAPASVDSPYVRGEFESVIKNIRESTLATMRARDQIDDAQFRAGDWVRRMWEAKRISSGVVDPSYEPVDTSGRKDPIPDRAIEAAKKLVDARKHSGLGGWEWALIEMICVYGYTVQESAQRRFGNANGWQNRWAGQTLRDGLDGLAVYLGYATRKCA